MNELEKLGVFTGLAGSILGAPDEWCAWYMSGKPEVSALPGEWEDKCTELQRMCLLRALRADRVLFSAARFVASNIGAQFADPPPFDLQAVFKTSSCKTPLIFILSPGVDPTNQVLSLSNIKGTCQEENVP